MSTRSADLVGLRVVLRRRAGIRDGRVVYSDVLGRLVDVTDGVLTVRRDDGSTVTVAAQDVHRLRAVPPGRADILALEEIAARGWPAPQTERLGGWLLRAGGGWTRRANSALLLGDPGMPVPDALERVRAWYDDRGLRPVVAVPLPAQAPADATAATLGWAADVDVDVLTAALPGDRPPVPGVLVSDRLTPQWEAVYRARTVPPVGRRILTAPETVAFASLGQDGRTVAIGRGVVVDGWLGVAAVEVLAGHRRRGLGRRVTAALLGWGASRGARRCYLQVEADNAAAQGLYAALGFTRHHRYRNRAAP
jgi:N-acetylglutamate synthase